MNLEGEIRGATEQRLTPRISRHSRLPIADDDPAVHADLEVWVERADHEVATRRIELVRDRLPRARYGFAHDATSPFGSVSSAFPPGFGHPAGMAARIEVSMSSGRVPGSYIGSGGDSLW